MDYKDQTKQYILFMRMPIICQTDNTAKDELCAIIDELFQGHITLVCVYIYTY